MIEVRRPDRRPGGLEQIERPLGKSHHLFEVSWPALEAAPGLFRDRGTPRHAPIGGGDHHCLHFPDPDGNLLELVGCRESH